MHSGVSSILLALLLKARETAQQNSVGEQKKEEEEEEDLSLAYAARGQGITLRYIFHYLYIRFNLEEHFFRTGFCLPQVLPDIRWWATSIR